MSGDHDPHPHIDFRRFDDDAEDGRYTVEDIRELVTEIDGRESLETLLEAEQETFDRKTAKAAITERIESLAEADADAEAEPEPAAETDVSEQDNTARDGHSSIPAASGDTTIVVVRNPDKTAKHLPDLRGTIQPGETKRYPETAILQKYIAQGELQVVTTR